MTFEDVRQQAEGLTSLISARTERRLVETVTVPEPEEPLDELHFVQLVSWGYVFLNEAGGALFKELARFLKSSSPDLSKLYQDGKRDVEALRTSFAHNLAENSPSNERTRRLAEAWLLQNGYPSDWKKRCTALNQTLHKMLEALRESFTRLCDDDDGTGTSLNQLLEAIDKAWPPHLFDGLIAEIAHDIKLPSLDAAAFRKPRQEGWAKLASLFLTREEATIAMKRVIRAELHLVFGPNPNEKL